MTFKLRHIGVAVPDIAAALPGYENVFGYRVLSGPVYDPVQNVHVCFIGSGDPAEPVIELVAPGSDQSPVSKILAKGIGAYHVCYEVADIEAALAEVRSKGCLVVSPPVPAVAFDGRRIAWFYTPTRQLIELLEA